MKKTAIILSIFFLGFFLLPADVIAQCSICTKNAQQLGTGPASGLNSGILYLAFAPMLIVGFVSYKWWKNQKDVS